MHGKLFPVRSDDDGAVAVGAVKGDAALFEPFEHLRIRMPIGVVPADAADRDLRVDGVQPLLLRGGVAPMMPELKHIGGKAVAIGLDEIIFRSEERRVGKECRL